MRAFYLLYVPIYKRATLFDYFIQFLTVSPIYSVKVFICPVLYRHIRHKRSSTRSRQAARGRAPRRATNTASPTRPVARMLNPVLAGGGVVLNENPNLTLPLKGHMTSACWSPTGCLVGYMMSRGLFRKQTLELYSSAEACHNVAVHP